MPRSIRGAHPITIDDRRLYWRFGDPSPPNGIGWFHQLTVFSVSGGTSRLIALTRDDDLPYAPYKESRFKPRWVEAIVRLALEIGWLPEATGPDFRMRGDYMYIIQNLEENSVARFWESYRSQGD